MLLIHSAGFLIAAAVLFGCVARGFGSRRWLRDGAFGLLLGLGVFLFFVRFLYVTCGLLAAADPRGSGRVTEPSARCSAGFDVALTPENLLWALVGVTLGTASACCRASARR